MPEDKLLPKEAHGRQYFSKAREAREALQEKAKLILALYLTNIKRAGKAGNHEVVQKSLEFLMEHFPADEEGTKLIDPSVDKTRSDSGGPTGPTIQIGFSLGGIKPRESLPPAATEVIDVTPTPTDLVKVDTP